MSDTPKISEAQMNISERLSRVEEKQDKERGNNRSSSNPSAFLVENENISLYELWNVVWMRKWLIILGTSIFALLWIAYALSLPNQYRSEGVYALAQRESGISSLAAKYGGIAAMAGINLSGGENNDIEQAVEIVESWPFLEDFINKYQIKPYIMAVRKWDPASNRLIWDEELYDHELKVWTREPPPGREAEPSSYEVYRVFKEMLAVAYDERSGLFRLSVEHYSPNLAAEWAKLITAELNRHFQLRDMTEAKKNIDYLEKKIKETGISEMQSVFYGMIEDHH